MKKVISLLLTAVMALSSLTVAFATEVPTVTVGDFDATAVEDNGYVILPVTIDKFPDGSLKIVQLDFTFDKTKLAFMGAYGMDMSGNTTMQVWNTSAPVPTMYKLEDATWSNTDAATVNANGAGTALFSDSTGTKKNFSAANSLAANNKLVYLWFTKVAGAEGTTTVDFSEIILTDTAANTSGTSYKKTTSEVIGKAGTVTFTKSSGPVDTVEVEDYFIGDKTAAGNDDESDKAVAVYAELNGDAEKTYTKVNWTVTAGTEKSHTQNVNVTGEATYKFGLVIRGLAQDAVTAVAAALAE